MSESVKPESPLQPQEEVMDEEDIEEIESVAWENLKEGNEEALEERLLPETEEVEEIEQLAR